jgi:hypothetical protein
MGAAGAGKCQGPGRRNSKEGERWLKGSASFTARGNHHLAQAARSARSSATAGHGAGLEVLTNGNRLGPQPNDETASAANAAVRQTA